MITITERFEKQVKANQTRKLKSKVEELAVAEHTSNVLDFSKKISKMFEEEAENLDKI